MFLYTNSIKTEIYLLVDKIFMWLKNVEGKCRVILPVDICLYVSETSGFGDESTTVSNVYDQLLDFNI